MRPATDGKVAAAGHDDRIGLVQIVAIGIGGMVGGGIFAVLGLALATAGHAVALAFALGGGVALLTGLSYARLGLAFRGDGGSFTYIEHAFASPAVAGVAGWLLVAGYVGTLALYASTFGAYGAAMLLGHDSGLWADGLALAVLLAFLLVNLAGARTSGGLETLIVGIKLAILLVFAVAGAASLEAGRLVPALDQGAVAPFLAAALIFVAYEGFELIPNAIDEMRRPERDLGRGLVIAILVTTAVYIAVAAIAGATLTPEQVQRQGDYALAVAARPALGQAGFFLIGLAALLSTASAINATLFGAARLAMVMACDHALPRVFSLRERSRPVPWVALVALTLATGAMSLGAGLGFIASFASATFLLIFAAVNLAAWRLARRIGIARWIPGLGALLTSACLLGLLLQTWKTSPGSLALIGGAYAAAILGEAALSLARGRRRPPIPPPPAHPDATRGAI